jgi:hypothetical protein
MMALDDVVKTTTEGNFFFKKNKKRLKNIIKCK